MMGAQMPQGGDGGLGIGNQAMFNLPRGLEGFGQVGGMNAPSPSLKFSIQRSASSDPLQQMMNNFQNPLGFSMDFSQMAPMAPKPQPQRQMPGLMNDPNAYDPWRHGATMAPPGQFAGQDFRQTMGIPGQAPKFPLKNKMMMGIQQPPVFL